MAITGPKHVPWPTLEQAGRAGASQRWETSSRYYIALVQQNLFGDWEVMRIWGGKASARGGMLCQPATDQADALGQLSEVARVRERRGYCRTLQT
jgi:predicted DNA-binding WGR domain protein